jgi:hypothetical protein
MTLARKERSEKAGKYRPWGSEEFGLGKEARHAAGLRLVPGTNSGEALSKTGGRAGNLLYTDWQSEAKPMLLPPMRP